MYFNNTTDTKINNKNKKIIILISIIIFFAITISLVLLFTIKKTEYYLTLNGNKDLILYTGSTYIESGFNAYDSKGNTYNDEVIVSGSVDTSIAGDYIITYTFNDITETRLITVISNADKKTILGLYGDSVIIIPLNTVFTDPGYYVIDSDHTAKELQDKVIVKGDVDTSTKGTYKITYTITNDAGISITKERTIIVTNAEFTLDYNPKEPTNKEVQIYGLINNNYFDYIILPDGTIETNRNISYTVTENNTYTFTLFLKDGSSSEEIMIIDNIDQIKPTGKCTATLNTNTDIVVDAKDNSGILKYDYIIGNNKYPSNNNTYTIAGLNRDAKVTIYDNASNSDTITCEVIDYSWPKKITPLSESTEKPIHYNQKGKFNNLNYIVYYPNDMTLDDKHPLVVFLHGGGECSNYISGSFNDNTAFANNLKSGKFKSHAVYLAPQCDCSAENSWKYCTENVKKLIDKVVKEYNINEKRISISCHSLGCTATYDLAEKYKDFFSAIALLAPSINTYDANKYRNFKTVVITGTRDGLHGINKGMAEYMQKKGVNMKFIEPKGWDHNIQPYAFNQLNTIEWMINQERK